MNSFETAASTHSHFHLPQHAQHHPQDTHRVLEDIATPSDSSYIYSCAPPSPQIQSYFNPLTNRTSYIMTEVRVHEIGILYNYEIHHESGISWENEVEVEGDDGGRGDGMLDKAGKFFSNLFGSGDEEDEDEERGRDEGDDFSDMNNDGNQELTRLEKEMVSQLWKNLLEDERMTWVLQQEECAGLVTTENEQGRKEEDEEEATRTRIRQLLWKQQQQRQQESGSGGQIRNLEGEGEGDVTEVDALDADDTAGTNTMTEGDILDTEETLDVETPAVNYSTFSGTKLLGLTYHPLDYVNHHGCLVPDKTCTSIHGQLSAAYSGVDEYSVIQTLLTQLQTGMDDGSFLPPNSPALNLEFTSSGGTVPVGGGASSYGLTTARGTTLDDPLGEEESYLSQYGISFVCLVAILGAATFGAVFARYRKRQKRIARAKGEEGVEWSEEDYEAHLARQQAEEGVEDGERKTAEESDSRSGTESPMSAGAWTPTGGAQHVPAVNSDGSEVEISLSDSKSFSF